MFRQKNKNGNASAKRYVKTEGRTKKGVDFPARIEKKSHVKAIIMCAMCAAVLIVGGIKFSPQIQEAVAVSSTVGDRELPIYCVQTEEKKVALSFDAAWGNDDTARMLEILANHNIHVTFFMTGGWVETYPDDVKAIYEAGHDLGNHSQNHKNMSQLSNEEIAEELNSVTEKVKELTGYQMFLFRPPYGDYDNEVVNVAKDCGYYTIQWDVDSLDWKDYGVDAILDTVCNHKHLGNGSIILCHNGAKYTADALETLITGLQEQGYEIVPISELIYKENYHMDHEGRQVPDKVAEGTEGKSKDNTEESAGDNTEETAGNNAEESVDDNTEETSGGIAEGSAGNKAEESAGNNVEESTGENTE